MRTIGLTGGIGAGKSTVAAALAGRGARVIDADRLAREVVEPGGAAYDGLVARFGSAVLEADGRLDRGALAAVVFADAGALADLNRITHPAIGTAMAARLAEAREELDGEGDRGVAVLDIPLLNPDTVRQWAFSGVLVVDAPVEVAVRRLVAHRGLAEQDARARVAAQMTREERRALAGLVIDNSGPPEALAAEIDRAWAWITALPPGP